MPEKKKKPDIRKSETDGYIDITQCGVKLRIPIGKNVPLDAYIAFFRRDDEMLGTELLLGEEQWAAFMAAKPTVGDFAEIGEQLTDALGN